MHHSANRRVNQLSLSLPLSILYKARATKLLHTHYAHVLLHPTYITTKKNDVIDRGCGAATAPQAQATCAIYVRTHALNISTPRVPANTAHTIFKDARSMNTAYICGRNSPPPVYCVIMIKKKAASRQCLWWRLRATGCLSRMRARSHIWDASRRSSLLYGLRYAKRGSNARACLCVSVKFETERL